MSQLRAADTEGIDRRTVIRSVLGCLLLRPGSGGLAHGKVQSVRGSLPLVQQPRMRLHGQAAGRQPDGHGGGAVVSRGSNHGGTRLTGVALGSGHHVRQQVRPGHQPQHGRQRDRQWDDGRGKDLDWAREGEWTQGTVRREEGGEGGGTRSDSKDHPTLPRFAKWRTTGRACTGRNAAPGCASVNSPVLTRAPISEATSPHKAWSWLLGARRNVIPISAFLASGRVDVVAAAAAVDAATAKRVVGVGEARILRRTGRGLSGEERNSHRQPQTATTTESVNTF